MKRCFTALLLVIVVALNGTEPLLRFGAISDNHLDRNKPDSHLRTELAFKFFRKHNIRFFVDAGDVADTYQPDMFKLWRQMYQETFAGVLDSTDFLMIPAGHDKSGVATEDGYADFVKHTGSGEINPVKVVNGYHFVSLAQWQNINILKHNLEKAVAASKPGQPIFVITHVPPKNTTSGSSSPNGGDAKVRKLLNSYPQVIALSGHTHNRLMDERSIWQGEFTAVNIGTLAYCGDGGVANPADRPKSYDASVWEVYKDKVVVRRFNVQSGMEIFPERRWTIRLPYDPATAEYSVEKRQEFPVPAFSAGHKIEFEPGFAAAHRWGKMQLPPLSENAFALLYYDVHVEKKNSAGSFEHYGKISFVRCAMPDSQKGECFAFPAGYLEADSCFRVTAVPVSYFNRTGTAVTGIFSVGKVPWSECKAAWQPVWQPWKSSAVLTPDADGFIEVKGDVRYLLPADVLAAARQQKKKNVIVTLDIECVGTGRGAYLRISNERNRIISPNIGNYRKDGQKQRYSFVFQPDSKCRNCYILIRRGADAKFRFSNMKFFIY